MKPSVFLACAAAVVAIAGCNAKQGDAATNAPAKVTPVKAPKSGDWTQVVSATPAGAFVMGNPNAKVKLIEYGSLTCPHCRAFDEEGVPALINNYVKTGQVSWEFRNYVRDAVDLTAALVARCNGPKAFFPLTRALYKDQPVWVGKVDATPQDQLEKLQNLPPSTQFVQLAKVAGFSQWAASRGVPEAKSQQCLSNQKAVDQLIQMTGDTTNQFPDFVGTPTFILNGTMVPETATWDKLEPALRKALGERG
ncbi:MAG TPA: thioredoxin domain-containing protein, partial [Sphingomicrobium sp.]